MIRLAAALLAVVLFVYSAWRSGQWWLAFRDPRSFGNFLNSLALLVGAAALFLVAYVVDVTPVHEESVIEVVTWAGTVVLLTVGLTNVLNWRRADRS